MGNRDVKEFKFEGIELNDDTLTFEEQFYSDPNEVAPMGFTYDSTYIAI